MFSDRDAGAGEARDRRPRAARRAPAAWQEAVAFGDAILIAVPYVALPAIQQAGRRRSCKGKVVIDPNNPVPARDGDMAVAAKREGRRRIDRGAAARRAHRAQLQFLGLRDDGARGEPSGAAHGAAGRCRRRRRR